MRVLLLSSVILHKWMQQGAEVSPVRAQAKGMKVGHREPVKRNKSICVIL